MTALADLQARVRRLEQRQQLRRGAAVCPVPADAADLRTVLKMAIEAGALINPQQGSPFWRLRELLRNQPDYGQEDDSNATPGTSDPAEPIFDALARMGA